MTLVFIAFTVITAMIAAAESYYERDWPRETGRFFVWSAFLTTIWIGL